MDNHDLGPALLPACHLHGEFQLGSGAISPEYFDKYRFESDPRLLHEVAVQFAIAPP